MPGLKGVTNAQRIALMPQKWREIADGTVDLATLSDEEVFKGRLRGVNGTMGPRPAFYPQNFIDEQIRRSLDWANDEIRTGARDAIAVFKEVMNNPQAADADRLRAAMFFTDRFLGKEVTRVMVTSEDPVESLFRQLLQDESGLMPPAPRELSADERALL